MVYNGNCQTEICLNKEGDIKGSQVSIVVVDDNREFRETVKATIAKENDMKVVGEAADGEEALKIIDYVKPDVVLYEEGLDERDTKNALDEISKADLLPIYPTIPHIFTSLYLFQVGPGAIIYIRKTFANILPYLITILYLLVLFLHNFYC